MKCEKHDDGMATICDETRILLTNQCNYRCGFCHNEGNSKGISHTEPNRNQLQKAISEMIRNGCRDITFTGGEPLLKHELLLDTIRFIRAQDTTLPITIVTNASLLKPVLLDAIASFGNIRFNVSFHSASSTIYTQLTGQKWFSLDDLSGRLNAIRNRNIPFKMNAVILRRTMSDSAMVAQTIDYAKAYGASSCKLVELLIVKQNESLANDYLAAESVAKLLPDNFQFAAATLRGRTYRNADGFTVELRKCRCHFGCAACIKNPVTASLDERGNFWACFAKTDLKDNLAELGYTETLNKGNGYLRTMLHQYGKYSPSLIRPMEMVSEYRQVWFQVDTESVVRDVIDESNPCNTRTFEEIFFKQESVAESEHEQIVLIHSNQHDPQNAGLIVANITVEMERDLPVNRICFFDPKGAPVRGNTDYITRFLRCLGLVPTFEITVEERQFIFDDVRFATQKTENNLYLYVTIDSESSWKLAVDFSKRDGITPLALPYQKIVKL